MMGTGSCCCTDPACETTIACKSVSWCNCILPSNSILTATVQAAGSCSAITSTRLDFVSGDSYAGQSTYQGTSSGGHVITVVVAARVSSARRVESMSVAYSGGASSEWTCVERSPGVFRYNLSSTCGSDCTYDFTISHSCWDIPTAFAGITEANYASKTVRLTLSGMQDCVCSGINRSNYSELNGDYDCVYTGGSWPSPNYQSTTQTCSKTGACVDGSLSFNVQIFNCCSTNSALTASSSGLGGCFSACGAGTTSCPTTATAGSQNWMETSNCGALVDVPLFLPAGASISVTII